MSVKEAQGNLSIWLWDGKEVIEQPVQSEEVPHLVMANIIRASGAFVPIKTTSGFLWIGKKHFLCAYSPSDLEAKEGFKEVVLKFACGRRITIGVMLDATTCVAYPLKSAGEFVAFSNMTKPCEGGREPSRPVLVCRADALLSVEVPDDS